MGRTPDIPDEIRVLRDVIREAHEAVKDLRSAIRDAQQLAPDLTKRFEEHANREMRDLDNHLQAETNRKAAELNAAVHIARDAIVNQLLITEMVLDPDTQSVSFHFPRMKFNDLEQLPHPEVLPKEGHP